MWKGGPSVRGIDVRRPGLYRPVNPLGGSEGLKLADAPPPLKRILGHQGRLGGQSLYEKEECIREFAFCYTPRELSVDTSLVQGFSLPCGPHSHHCSIHMLEGLMCNPLFRGVDGVGLVYFNLFAKGGDG
jgi:hypothetical protein